MLYTGYQNYERKPSFVAIRSQATAVGERVTSTLPLRNPCTLVRRENGERLSVRTRGSECWNLQQDQDGYVRV
jgi:hypothetical protein